MPLSAQDIRGAYEARMSQTWLGSIVESWANIAIGFGINYAANLAVLPLLWDDHNRMASAFWIGCVFTVISQIRQIVIRRWFNGMKFGNKPMTQSQHDSMLAMSGITPPDRRK